MSNTDLVFDIFAIDRASAVFTRVGREAEGAGASAERGARAMNAALIGAGAIAVGFGVKAIEMAGNFQASMSRLTTTAGELPSNMAVVTAGIEQMAGKVGYSVQDLANAMYLVESGGFHGAAALKVLQAAAEGARIEGSNVTDVAHALAGALNDYHGSTLTATEATNAMTSAVGHGMMTFQDLAEAMPNIGARAAAAHVTFEEMLAALGTMTRDGLPAAKAATFLGQSIGQLAAPTAKARTEMANLGINATEVAATITSGSGHGLADAISLLYDGIQHHLVGAGLLSSQALHQMASSTSGYQKVLANLPPTVQTSIQALAEMSGGVRSFQGILMLGGQHADQYRQTLDAVNKSVHEGGKSITGWAQIQSNFNQRLADAKGAASALGVELGTDLLPITDAVMSGFIDFTGFLSQNKAAVLDVATGAAVAAGVLVTLKGAALGVAAAQALAATAAEGFGAGEVILNLQLAATAFATEGAASGFAFLGAAMDATPFGVIALGIGGIAAGIMALTGAFGGASSADAAFHSAMQQVDQATGPSVDHLQSLAGTYDSLTGSITKATYAMVEQDLERAKVIGQAQQLGISELTLAQASLGNAGSIRVVNRAIDEQTSKLAALDARRAADKAQWESMTHGAALGYGYAQYAKDPAAATRVLQDYQNTSIAANNLRNAIDLVNKALGNEAKTVQGSRTDWKNAALAASDAAGAFNDLKDKADFINQPLAKNARQIAELAIAFHLSGQQIHTVLHDEMVKGTVQSVDQIIANLKRAGDYHFDMSNVLGSWAAGLNTLDSTTQAKMTQIGTDMKTGLQSGFAGVTTSLAATAASAVLQAEAAARKAAQSHSPSVLFKNVGADLLSGLVLGVTENSSKAERAAEAAIKRAAAAAHRATMEGLHVSELQLGFALSDTNKAIGEVTKEIDAAQQWASSFKDNVFTAALTTPLAYETLHIGGVSVRAQTGGQALPANASAAQTLAAMMAYEKNAASQNAALAADIKTLRAKGLSQIALDEIKGSGKNSLAEISALAGASKAQVAAFNALELQANNSLLNAGAWATSDRSYASLKKRQASEQSIANGIKRGLRGIKLEIANGGHTLRVTG